MDWLLDADPAIRWQVLRDLTDAQPDEVTAERRRIATEGWGARLLARQAEDGQWGGRPWSHDWTDTFHALELLRRFGLDPDSPEAQTAIERVQANVTWAGGAPVETPWSHHRFFEGEVEPCINGNVVATGAYFGIDVALLVARLLAEQLADGGWNCEAENGATVSSAETTLNVLEGLLEYERATGGEATVAAARRLGEGYLLDRGLFRRKSTGEVIDPAWLRFAFPPWYHYDVLRALDHFRAAGDPPDPRVAEAVRMVEGRRDADGRWPLDRDHEGARHLDVDDGEGRPSRWITLRALRVHGWWGRG